MGCLVFVWASWKKSNTRLSLIFMKTAASRVQRLHSLLEKPKRWHYTAVEVILKLLTGWNLSIHVVLTQVKRVRSQCRQGIGSKNQRNSKSVILVLSLWSQKYAQAPSAVRFFTTFPQNILILSIFINIKPNLFRIPNSFWSRMTFQSVRRRWEALSCVLLFLKTRLLKINHASRPSLRLAEAVLASAAFTLCPRPRCSLQKTRRERGRSASVAATQHWQWSYNPRTSQ